MIFIFDIDDTFYKRSQPFIKACEQLFKGRFDMDFNEFYKVREKHSEACLEASQLGQITMEEMYNYRLNNALKEYGYEISLEEVLEFEKVYNYYQSIITLDKPFDELLPYLYDKHIEMGILTNGPSKHQKDKAYAMHIEQWIPDTKWIVSGDYNGIIKPHPEIFHIAEKVLNVKEDIYFIGDNYKSDICGAKNVGWHTIWYDHAHKSNEESISDYIVQTPEELMECVKRIVGSYDI